MTEPANNIAFVDCFSGISGDMFVAALIDAGLPLPYLTKQLQLLGLTEYSLQAEKHCQQNGIAATSFSVQATNTLHHRTWADIRHIIKQSRLPPDIKNLSLSIFTTLAEAEASVHQCPVDQVHFHEVGAVDSIIDITAAAIGLDYFHITKLTASPLPYNRGWVQCEHGTLPLPAPAVCQMLHNVPVEECQVDTELLTPTGVAILKGSTANFGPLPTMQIKMIGHGAGAKMRNDHKPNILRILIGSDLQKKECQRIEIIETNLDDWSPESFPYVTERLLNSGALDVSLSQILMKKGRPGFRIQVLAPLEKAQALKEILLTETTAIGIRFRQEERLTLPRELGYVISEWGKVAVKRVTAPSGAIIYPEYEACAAVARTKNIPIKEVYRSVAGLPASAFQQEISQQNNSKS